MSLVHPLTLTSAYDFDVSNRGLISDLPALERGGWFYASGEAAHPRRREDLVVIPNIKKDVYAGNPYIDVSNITGHGDEEIYDDRKAAHLGDGTEYPPNPGYNFQYGKIDWVY